MQAPRTSFVMPTYNRAYIIGTAIQSILDQTDSDWELLVIDDGSIDDSETVVASFEDERIRYYQQVNQGAAAARNYGMSLARGEWVAYDGKNELIIKLSARKNAPIISSRRPTDPIRPSSLTIQRLPGYIIQDTRTWQIDLFT